MAVVQPKRIIKKGGGHHGGSWKVAYADFVTAMMALFMVLWILGQSPEVKNQIQFYFTDPRGIPIASSSKSLLDNAGAGVLDKLPVMSPLNGGEGQGPAFAKAPNAEGEKQKLEKAAEQIKKEFAEKPELAEIAKSVQVTVDADGLRIELTDQVEGAFFDLGSTAPKEALRQAVREVIKSLGGIDNDIVIEGHTDGRPFAGGDSGYSNWELSAERGNAVRRTLKDMGVPSDRIREVRAYADRRPLPGADPLEARNRRVSILVQSKGAAAPPPTAEGEPGAAPPKFEQPKTGGSLVDALKPK